MSDKWAQVLGEIKNKISEVNYNAWFGKVECLEFGESELKLAVPNNFTKEWLADYYSDTIRNEVRKITGSECSLQFEICEELLNSSKNLESENSSADSESSSNSKTNLSDENRPAGTLSASVSARSAVRAPIGDPLNPKYTFDRFVVGSNNQFATAACKAVADLPGGNYNPLFLYGGVGLGKTHLVNAIGLELLRRHPGLRLLYIGSERFMNEVINGIRFDKMADLRRKYRESCDILLMDDIQFLAGKERTQEEFFHTFNCLHEAGKQIVVTSDKFPKDIKGLEERLRSRFEWGLIADIQPPDLETRIAILQKKADASDIHLPDDVSIYLAQQIRSNVRELEGSLIRLSAFSSLNGSPITIELARNVLKNIIREVENRCTIEAIQKVVASYYSIKVTDMKSARRMKHLAYPRQIAMFLCKKHVKSSFPEIGQKFGGKDHTTVMHACRKIDKLLKTDTKLRDDIEFIEKSLTH